MTPRVRSESDVTGSVDGRRLLGAVAVVVLVALVGIAASAAVVAQSQPEPGTPVNFYGSAADEAGNEIPAGTPVYALVDGEVEDVLTAGTTGLGGPGAFDDKLAVNSTAGQTVTFAVNSPDGTTAMDTVNLGSADAVTELSLTLPNGSFVEVDVNGDGNDATDTTDNGRLNDVNGDGDFDITDVQTLFDFLDEPAIQDNVAAFDFDDDNRVSIFDVQTLFRSL